MPHLDSEMSLGAGELAQWVKRVPCNKRKDLSSDPPNHFVNLVSQTICGSSCLCSLYDRYTPSFCGRMGGWDRRILKAGQLAWCTNSTQDPMLSKMVLPCSRLPSPEQTFKTAKCVCGTPLWRSQYSPGGGLYLLRDEKPVAGELS